jgi:hypothetical protein
MDGESTNKNNYDIASISLTGQEKRTNHVRHALFIEHDSTGPGQFIKVFADIFLKREASSRSIV